MSCFKFPFLCDILMTVHIASSSAPCGWTAEENIITRAISKLVMFLMEIEILEK